MPQCRFWVQGRCRDGDQCRFSHDGEQQPAPAPRVCTFWEQKGRCRDGENCRFSHNGPRGTGEQQPPPAPRVCTFWEKNGRCRDGENCRFSHNGPRGSPAPRVCRFWAEQGSCREGELCPYSHDGPQGARRDAADGSGADRRMFDKCTKDATSRLLDERAAVRFAEAVESYSDGDLPWRLTRRDEYGLRKLVEAIMVGGTSAVLPIIRALARPEWKDPRFKDALCDCWHELYAGRGIIESLTVIVQRGSLKDCEARNLEAIAEMVMALVLAERPRDASAALVRSLADALIDASRKCAEAKTALRRAERCVQLLQGGAQATAPAGGTVGQVRRPGGRHANDHQDFRSISVVPTLAEAQCDKAPFLPRSQDEDFLHEDPETQLLDRHFRLLREDMLAPLREHIGVGTGERFEVTLAGFDLQQRGVEYIERNGEDQMRPITSPGPIGILFLLQTRMKPEDFLETLQQRGQLRPGNLVLLQKLSEDGTVTNLEFGRAARLGMSREYATRVELCTTFSDPVQILAFHSERLQLLPVGGSFFAYEPVLQCLQSKVQLQFGEEMLLQVHESPAPDYPGVQLLQNQLDRQLNRDGVNIDAAQRAAFRYAIEHRVAMIVGPPGTGKSFVAVELALAVLNVTDLTILVVCYTNHALDDFLGRMLERGAQKIVRVGGRSKEARLEPFNLKSLAVSAGHQNGQTDRKRIWELKKEQVELREKMRRAAQTLEVSSLRWEDARDAIESAEGFVVSMQLIRQLSVVQTSLGFTSDSDDDFTVVGKSGKKLRADQLWKAWQNGHGPEPFHERANLEPWTWALDHRKQKIAEWLAVFKREATEDFEASRVRYDALDRQLTELHRGSERAVLKGARVIGATTTGAAKYKTLIEAANVGFVLTEEAGEVLEAHVHTSLSESTRHLVMIGDHRQLRPKIEAHALTVAAGNGHDLNRSLFERLILGGLPYAELEVQHRMRPEIADIARHMTYPTLRDGDAVAQRPDVRGLAGNVVFITHSQPEQGSGDALFGGALSKTNQHEANVSVQIVSYLLAHGYNSENLVVLTPYLGQLRHIKSCMKKAKMDAVIGEKDAEELLLLGDAVQPWQVEKNQLRTVRVSTVDNYQGEEADVVIASLVRSNDEGQLGFLGKADAEQRVNVLCTRARSGLILIGNSTCLGKSPLWRKLLGFLRQRGCVYEGLPVKCERHGKLLNPSSLSTPQQLEQLVARGAGCESRCDTILDCGHPCPLHCHPFGHDQVNCPHLVPTRCRAGLHRINRVCCEQSPPPCNAFVVDQCERAHPVVRRCQTVEVRCRVCDVLNKGEAEHATAVMETAEKKTTLLAQFAKEELAGCTSKKEQKMRGDAIDGLKKLAKDLEARQHELDVDLGQKIEEAEAQTRNEIARAGRAQVQQRERDERELAARQARTREQLRVLDEQMAQRRAEAQAEAEAEVRRRDEELQRLHDALQRDLKTTQEALDEAVSARPDKSKVEKQLDEVREMAPGKDCSICMDNMTLLDGVLCQTLGQGHFICKPCFDGHVKNEAERQEFKGEIRCPFTSPALGGCSSVPYKDAIIAHLAPEAFEVYSSAKLKLSEAKIAKEMESTFNERLAKVKAEMEAASHEVKVKGAREHIIENILTLRCPRCGQAFLDFVGCFALTCARQSCGCAFCAHCLKDCGGDAHACAAQCGRSRGMDVFGSMEAFEEIQKERRRRLVKEYLSGAEWHGGLRTKVLIACKSELADLGIEEL